MNMTYMNKIPQEAQSGGEQRYGKRQLQLSVIHARVEFAVGAEAWTCLTLGCEARKGLMKMISVGS